MPTSLLRVDGTEFKPSTMFSLPTDQLALPAVYLLTTEPPHIIVPQRKITGYAHRSAMFIARR